jgi:hypothetical protein
MAYGEKNPQPFLFVLDPNKSIVMPDSQLPLRSTFVNTIAACGQLVRRKDFGQGA